jgi:sugar phosphate isomerase/epimerase
MRLSIQLYTVRELLKQDVAGTLTSLKATGLNSVEMAGLYDVDLQDWKNLLAEIGLTVSGSHESLDSLENDLDNVIAKNKTLGNTHVICPYLNKDVYANGWAPVAKRFEVIATELQHEGLSFAYHNHDFEFQLEDGKPGLDVLYENSDPNLVKAQLDLAWILQGGQNPAAYVAKYASRIDSVHLKDTKLAGKHTDVVAGQGDVNWDETLAACLAAGVATGSVEMDNPPTEPLADVAASVAFFQARGLG